MKRQRVKVLCKAKNCRAEFNSDYRLQHNRKQHGGRNVPFEAVGAPRKPFEAAKRRNSCSGQEQAILQRNISEIVSTRATIHQHQQGPSQSTESSQCSGPSHEFETKTESSSSLPCLNAESAFTSRKDPELYDEINPVTETTEANDLHTTSSQEGTIDGMDDLMVTEVKQLNGNPPLTLLWSTTFQKRKLVLPNLVIWKMNWKRYGLLVLKNSNITV